MGFTVNASDMTAALDKFGVPYEYPVYMNLADMTGFLASNKKLHYGYGAIAGGMLLLSDIGMLTGETMKEIPLMSIQSVKVKKFPLVGTYTVKLEYLDDARKDATS